jgi:hypothetical protein
MYSILLSILLQAQQTTPLASFFGFMGATAAIVFSCTI